MLIKNILITLQLTGDFPMALQKSMRLLKASSLVESARTTCNLMQNLRVGRF